MLFKSFPFLIFFIMLLSFGCATQIARPYLADSLLNKSNIDVSKIKTLSFLQVKEDIVLRGKKLTSLKAVSKITLKSPEIN